MLKSVIKFKDIPLADNLIKNKDDKINSYDLEIGFDTDTKLLQIKNNCSPEELFPEDYVYDSSKSRMMIQHFKKCAQDLKKRFYLNDGDEFYEDSNVMEIGSNSGIFIRNFGEENSFCIEPCGNFAKKTKDFGYKTYDKFWTNELAEEIKKKYESMDLIYAANTICHIQDLNECFTAINTALDDYGVFVVECPSLLEVLKNNAFDQFYHEHQSYFSLSSMINVLKSHKLKVFDVDFYPVHGGSYRYFITKEQNNSFMVMEDKIKKYLKEEKKFGLLSFKKIKDKFSLIEKNIEDVKETLDKLKKDGKKIIGYGATAKFSQLVNICGIDSDTIDFVVDTTKNKHNKYIPKSNIQILPYTADILTNNDIDYCYLGAWNYKDEILDKEGDFIEKGGKFISHIPEVNIF